MREITFKCQKTRTNVTLYIEVFRISGGIGDGLGFSQREFQCSNEESCLFRYDAACKVRLLVDSPECSSSR